MNFRNKRTSNSSFMKKKQNRKTSNSSFMAENQNRRTFGSSSLVFQKSPSQKSLWIQVWNYFQKSLVVLMKKSTKNQLFKVGFLTRFFGFFGTLVKCQTQVCDRPLFSGPLKGQNQCLELFMRRDEGEWMEKGITLIFDG